MNSKIRKASLLIIPAMITFIFANALEAQTVKEEKPEVQIPLDMNMDLLNEDGDLDPEDLKVKSESADKIETDDKNEEEAIQDQSLEESKAEEKPWWQKLW